jgi:hypothetical protein
MSTDHAVLTFSSQKPTWLRGVQSKKDPLRLQQPICQRCARLGRECSFSIAGSASSGVLYDQQTAPIGDGTIVCDKSATTTIPHLPNHELELIHHYTAVTCFTMTDDVAFHSIWQIDIPKYAFSHTFLLHELLAITALHHRSQVVGGQHDSFTELARSRQQQALASYIPLLQSIDETNCHSLFAFSSILGALSYAFLQLSENELTGEEYIKNFVDVFDLLLGSTVIAVQGRRWLRQGDLSPMMGPIPSLDRDMTECREIPKRALRDLLEHVDHLVPSHNCPDSFDGVSQTSIRQIYTVSIQRIPPLFPCEDEKVPAMSALIGWPIFAGAPYLSLLKKQDPTTLIVLAHHGTALHESGHIWWLKG